MKRKGQQAEKKKKRREERNIRQKKSQGSAEEPEVYSFLEEIANWNQITALRFPTDIPGLPSRMMRSC